jgi:hypothetical protein
MGTDLVENPNALDDHQIVVRILAGRLSECRLWHHVRSGNSQVQGWPNPALRSHRPTSASSR